MNTNQLFAEALPLVDPWVISQSQFEGDPKRLILDVGLKEGTTRLPCPKCQQADCGIHDRRERRWRHLNFWQYETELVARVPRVKCESCGIHQVEVPWAREGSGFTLLFEAMTLCLIAEMPVSQAAEIMGEHDTTLWRILRYYVNEARSKNDWSEVTRIAVDETSRKKGHNYVSNFVDLETGHLLFMTPGKDAATVGQFVLELVKYKGDAKAITEIAMDMSPAFKRGATEFLPNAVKVFDRFHVMKLAGEAFDEVRKEVGREVGGLGRGGMWALRGNEQRLTEEMRTLRHDLLKEHSKLGRAMGLREFLGDFWNYDNCDLALEHFDTWHRWARRCRMEPFKKLAKTLLEQWEGIAAYYKNWTTSAMIEAINGKLQLARKRARGYRNVENFQAIAYWIAGGIKPAANLPNPIPERF